MFGGYRTVVLDADESERTNLKLILQRAEYVMVGEAADGITGLKLVRARQPDLVFLDIFLPGMAGWELANIISQDRIAAVLLTCSRYNQDVLQKVSTTQAFGFVAKPTEESVLIPAAEFAVYHFRELVKLEAELRKLQTSLETRKVVERAKGIIMKKLGISEQEAFRLMQKQSMNKRVSMHKIAKAVILAESLKLETPSF